MMPEVLIAEPTESPAALMTDDGELAIDRLKILASMRPSEKLGLHFVPIGHSGFLC